jgi:hypothetical protein
VSFYFQDQNIWRCKHVEERVGWHRSKKEQTVAQHACAHVCGPGAIDRTEATVRAPIILTRPPETKQQRCVVCVGNWIGTRVHGVGYPTFWKVFNFLHVLVYMCFKTYVKILYSSFIHIAKMNHECILKYNK